MQRRVLVLFAVAVLVCANVRAADDKVDFETDSADSCRELRQVPWCR